MIKETGRLPFVGKWVHTGQNSRRALKKCYQPSYVIIMNVFHTLFLRNAAFYWEYGVPFWDVVWYRKMNFWYQLFELLILMIRGFFCMQKIQILKIDFFISDDYFILHQIRNFDVKKWFSDIRKAIFDIKNFKLIYWYQKF